MSSSTARIAATEARRTKSSVARVEANRRNAQRSTGPRTTEGKARVASNAYKHGLRSERNPLDLANDTALPFEREEFATTLAAFLDDLAPIGPIETRLVERLAQIDLRLSRAVKMETTQLDMHTGLLAKSMAGALPSGEGAEQTQHNWLTTLAFLKNPSATTLIAQYESRLARDFARTLTQLRQAQKLRTGRTANPLCPIGENSDEQTQPTGKEPRASASVLTGQPATSQLANASCAMEEPNALCSMEENVEQTQQPHPPTVQPGHSLRNNASERTSSRDAHVG